MKIAYIHAYIAISKIKLCHYSLYYHQSKFYHNSNILKSLLTFLKVFWGSSSRIWSGSYSPKVVAVVVVVEFDPKVVAVIIVEFDPKVVAIVVVVEFDPKVVAVIIVEFDPKVIVLFRLVKNMVYGLG